MSDIDILWGDVLKIFPVLGGLVRFHVLLVNEIRIKRTKHLVEHGPGGSNRR